MRPDPGVTILLKDSILGLLRLEHLRTKDKQAVRARSASDIHTRVFCMPLLVRRATLNRTRFGPGSEGGLTPLSGNRSLRRWPFFAFSI